MCVLIGGRWVWPTRRPPSLSPSPVPVRAPAVPVVPAVPAGGPRSPTYTVPARPCLARHPFGVIPARVPGTKVPLAGSRPDSRSHSPETDEKRGRHRDGRRNLAFSLRAHGACVRSNSAPITVVATRTSATHNSQPTRATVTPKTPNRSLYRSIRPGM